MNQFEKGFWEEREKIAEYAGYSDQEIKRLRHIMRRDRAMGHQGAASHVIGAGVGAPIGAGIGALAGGKGRRGKGALIGTLAGALVGPVVGTTANLAKHLPEINRLRNEALAIHKGKTKEQKQLIIKALWKGIPKSDS